MLSLSDLCAISDTCSRFEAIAKIVFPFEHKKVYLNSIWNDKNMNVNRSLLTKFGGSGYGNLDVLNNFCSDKLKLLHLNNFHIGTTQIGLMKQLFSNLESLKLEDCSIDVPVSEGLFSGCNQVIKLVFLSAYDETDFYKHAKYDFPNLKYLHIRDDEQHAEDFLINQTKLKEIFIDCFYMNESLFKFIADNMKSLEKMNITYNDSEVYPCMRSALATIGQIKILKISMDRVHFGGSSPSPSDDASIFLNRMNDSMESLTHLELSTCHTYLNVELIASIVQFQNLVRLKLYMWRFSNGDENYENDEQLSIEQLGNLPKLSVFHLSGKLKLSNGDLHQFVTKAEQLQSLTIDLAQYKIENEIHKEIVDIALKRNKRLRVFESGNSQISWKGMYIERAVTAAV